MCVEIKILILYCRQVEYFLNFFESYEFEFYVKSINL